MNFIHLKKNSVSINSQNYNIFLNYAKNQQYFFSWGYMAVRYSIVMINTYTNICS